MIKPPKGMLLATYTTKGKTYGQYSDGKGGYYGDVII